MEWVIAKLSLLKPSSGNGFEVDCKTVRIFAYSSTREQSNKRSGTRLLRHALPISLLILRKKSGCFVV